MEEIHTSKLHLSETFQRGFLLTKSYQDRIEYLSPILTPAITKIYLKSSVASLTLTSIKNETSSHGLRNEGNVFFKKGCYYEAHTFYTLSVATAPFESTCQSLAFANRSAALRCMGKLKECLEDIERALNHYPETLRFKLIIRQAQCYRDLGQSDRAKQSFHLAEKNLKALQLSEIEKRAFENTLKKEIGIKVEIKKIVCKNNEKLPNDQSLVYSKNTELLNASSAIAAKFDSVFGRHLVATRDINAGDVLIVEDPFALILEPQFRLTHCVHCTRRSFTLLPCPSCDWAMYCSEICRESAAESYHRTECAVVCRYCRVFQGQGSQDLLLLIRIVCTIGINQLHDLYEPYNKLTDSNPKLKGLTDLISHFQNRSVEDGIQDCVEVLNLTQCFQLTKDENKTKFASILLKILNQIYVNHSSITEMQINGINLHEDNSVQTNEVGCGIFLTGSLANHSCDPNTLVTYDGKTRIVRAAMPIKRNAQITTSYGPTFNVNTITDRTFYLKSKYYFDCHCNACEENWPEVELLPSLPVFSQDEKGVEKIINESAKMLAKNYDNGILIEETELQFFHKHLTLLCKHEKRLNQSFQTLQEYIRNIYRSKGNCYISYPTEDYYQCNPDKFQPLSR